MTMKTFAICECDYCLYMTVCTCASRTASSSSRTASRRRAARARLEEQVDLERVLLGVDGIDRLLQQRLRVDRDAVLVFVLVLNLRVATVSAQN